MLGLVVSTIGCAVCTSVTTTAGAAQIHMASPSEGAECDQEAVEAASLELLVLGRLIYRNRSQHRSAKVFKLVLKVRKACQRFAPAKLTGLLTEGLDLLSRLPNNRNNRAQESWVRSAATTLTRFRLAVLACSEALEAGAEASRLLAHQVSQTFFMPLCVALLACLARLFACNLYLGNRLLEIHNALLRTLQAQPCAPSCLPRGTLAACRIPEETASFLTRLRGAASSTSASAASLRKKLSSRAKTALDDASSALDATAAAAGATAANNNDTPNGSGSRTDGASSGNQSSDDRDVPLDNDDGDDDDDGDEGVLVGRLRAADGRHLQPSDDDGDFEPAGDRGDNWRISGRPELAEGEASVRSQDRGSRRAQIEGTVGQSGGGRRGAGKETPPPKKQQVVLASEFSDSDDSDSSSAEEDGALITDSGKGNARRRMEKKNLCATDAEVRTDACADANIGDINGGGSTRLSTGASKRLRSADTRKIRSLPRRANMEPAAPPPAKTRKPSCTFHDVATTSTTTTPPSPPVSTSAAHDSPEAKANGLSLSVAPSISPPSLPGPTFPSSPRAAARSPSHLFPTTRQHLPDALGQSMVMAGSAMTTPTPMKSQSIATLATTTSTPSAALSSATRNNDHGGDGNEDRRVRSGGRLGINSESSRTDGVGSVGRRAHENEKSGTLGGGRFGRRGSCPFSVDRRRGESAGGMTARMASPASPRESPTTENRGVGSDAPVDTIVPNRRYKRDRTEGEQQQHRQGTSVSPANQVSPSAVHRASTDVGKPSKRHTKKNSEKKKKKRMRGAESSAGGRPGGSGGAAAIDDIFDSIC